jgi:hypothetical protein
VAVLFATIMATHRHRALRAVTGSAVLAVSLLNLMGSGSWGQNVTISRELLSYAKAHPTMRFVTDYHTLNEMYVLNGVRPVTNVVTTDQVKPSQLLDCRAIRIAAADIRRCDAILLNPLNTARTPEFDELARRHTGRLRHETTPTYRMICDLLPPLRSQAWAVRKPPARVFACRGAADARLTWADSE